MLGLSRKERLQSALDDAAAALAQRDLASAQALYGRAQELARVIDEPRALAHALLGTARTLQPNDPRAALAAADAAACFSLVGDAPNVRAALHVQGAPALIAGRLLTLAEERARRDDAEGFATLANELLAIIAGAGADATVEACLRLATHAVVLERPDLCARFVFFGSGALRVLADASDGDADAASVARLARTADLVTAALSRARTATVLDDNGETSGPKDPWAFALADLLVELSEPRLDPLRRVRAHVLRARVMLDADRAADAYDSALIAFARARAVFGDEDALTLEAHALVTAADEGAPRASA
jgi:hypothetical protein